MSAPVLSNIVVTTVGNTINVTWNTDQLSDSTIEWGAIDPRGVATQLDLAFLSNNPALVFPAHSMTTPALIADNDYAIRIRSKNAAGEETKSTVFQQNVPFVGAQLTSISNIVVQTFPSTTAGFSRFKVSFRATSTTVGGPPIRNWTAQLFWGNSPTSLTNTSPIATQPTPNTQAFADFTLVDFGADSPNNQDVYYQIQINDGVALLPIKQLFVDHPQQDPENLRLYSRPDGVEVHWTSKNKAPGYLVKHAPSLQSPSKQLMVCPPQPLLTIRTQNSQTGNGEFAIVMKDGYIQIPGLIENNTRRMLMGGVTHCCFTWDGQHIELFINGSSSVKLASTFSFQALLGQAQITEVRVGTDFEGHYSEAFLGSLRISNKARTPADFNFGLLQEEPFKFTSPTAPLGTDANTLALYLFNNTPNDTGGAPGGPYNGTWVGAPIYGGPPFGLDGIVFPAAGKFRTPAANAYVQLPNAVFTDVRNKTPNLPVGSIEFWAIWIPDPAMPLLAPMTTRISGLRSEELRYVQVNDTYQEQSYQRNVTASGLIANFPTTNGTVHAMKVVGTTLLIGGDFTTVTDGAGAHARTRFAVIDLTTNLVTAAAPTFDSTVSDFAVQGGSLYVVGSFANVNATPRNLAVQLDLATFTVQPWNPVFTGTSAARVLIGDDGAVFICGFNLGTTNGFSQGNFVAIHPATSALLPNRTPIAAGGSGEIDGMKRSGSLFYFVGNFLTLTGHIGSTPVLVGRGRGGACDANTGDIFTWDPVCDNTITDVEIIGSKAFVGGFFGSLSGVAHNDFGATDATTGAVLPPTSASADNAVLVMHTNNNLLYCGGVFNTINPQAIPRLVAVDPVAVAALSTFSKSVVGTSVLSIVFNNGFVYFGGTFTSVLGTAVTDLAGVFDKVVLQNNVDPQFTVPSFVEWLFADAPDQLQIFQKDQDAVGDFSWRKRRPFEEDTFTIQWDKDNSFSTPFLHTVAEPRNATINVSGQAVSIEQFVVQGLTTQQLSQIRRLSHQWNFRGQSTRAGDGTFLPPLPSFTGQFSTFQERVVQLNGSISVLVPDTMVAGSLTVQSLDRQTTYIALADYILVNGQVSRTSTSTIGDGQRVILSYFKDSKFTVRQNIRFQVRDFLNSLLNEFYYDRDSKTTNVFKLYNTLGAGFEDVQIEVDAQLQDRFIETGVLEDLVDRFTHELSLAQPAGTFTVAWFQQAARAMMGATRLGGTFQGVRIATRGVTGQACDINAESIGFHIVGDTENPAETADDPDFYVGEEVEQVVDPDVEIIGFPDNELEELTPVVIVPPIDANTLLPGDQEIVILGDQEGLAWDLVLYDATYDFVTKGVRQGNGLTPGSIDLTILGTPAVLNQLQIDLGILGQHTTTGIQSGLTNIFQGDGIGGAPIYSAVPMVANNTPPLVGAEIVAALVTQINNPATPSVSAFFKATATGNPVANILHIESILTGPATNDFSLKILVSNMVTALTTNPLDPTGSFFEFQGGSISSTVLGIVDLVPNSISLIDNTGATIPATSYQVDPVSGAISFINGAPGVPAIGDSFTAVGEAFMGNGGLARGVAVVPTNDVLPAYAPVIYDIRESNPVDEPTEWGVASWGAGSFGGLFTLQ